MATEVITDKNKVSRYQECLRLANKFGQPFSNEVDGIPVDGKSCPHEEIEVGGQKLDAYLALGNIHYPSRIKEDQIKISWKPVNGSANGETPYSIYCGGIAEGRYNFVVHNPNEKSRLPTQEEIVLIDQIVRELGKTYTAKHSWWRKLLARVTHHNGYSLHR